MIYLEKFIENFSYFFLLRLSFDCQFDACIILVSFILFNIVTMLYVHSKCILNFRFEYDEQLAITSLAIISGN